MKKKEVTLINIKKVYIKKQFSKMKKKKTFMIEQKNDIF